MTSSSSETARLPVTLLADGRITIPHKIIEEWGIQKGDTIWVVFERPGKFNGSDSLSDDEINSTVAPSIDA